MFVHRLLNYKKPLGSPGPNSPRIDCVGAICSLQKCHFKMSWSQPKKPTNRPIFASGCSSVFLMWLDSGRSRDHACPGLKAFSTSCPGKHLWAFIYLSAASEGPLSWWRTRVVQAKFACDARRPRVHNQMFVLQMREAAGCFHILINLQGGTPHVPLTSETCKSVYEKCIFFSFPPSRTLTMSFWL